MILMPIVFKSKRNSPSVYLIVLIFSIIFFSFVISSCHKKVGVKPGGQLKKKTDKCLCKKKKGLYSSAIESQSTYYCVNLFSNISGYHIWVL